MRPFPLLHKWNQIRTMLVIATIQKISKCIKWMFKLTFLMEIFWIIYIYIYIYNNQKGFVFKGKKNMVCKLMKYLSGLKQSPHAWNLYLVLKEFERSSINYNVYFQIFQSDFYVIMTLYIDDFILAFNDLILFDRNKGQCFK
jgi:hypothetical protein